MQLSTLQEQKDAVDSAIANSGLLLFYGHCNSEQLGYFTEENFDELLTYIDGKVVNFDCVVLKPTEAMTQYYAIRYEDVITE